MISIILKKSDELRQKRKNKIEELFSVVNQSDHTTFSLFSKGQFNDVYHTCGFVTPISKDK